VTADDYHVAQRRPARLVARDLATGVNALVLIAVIGSGLFFWWRSQARVPGDVALDAGTATRVEAPSPTSPQTVAPAAPPAVDTGRGSSAQPAPKRAPPPSYDVPAFCASAEHQTMQAVIDEAEQKFSSGLWQPVVERYQCAYLKLRPEQQRLVESPIRDAFERRDNLSKEEFEKLADRLKQAFARIVKVEKENKR
jgi:hypothetical protein